MSYPDQDINLATDARANQPAPPVDFAVSGGADLAQLRARWAAMPSIPKILAVREAGEDNSWPGFDVRTLLRGEESSGRWSVHSLILAPGSELPPHTYDGNVYWFVMDGEGAVTIGDRAATLPRHASAYAPAHTTQAIANHSSRPVHVLVAHSPAGSDRAFAAAHALSRTRPDSSAADYIDALSRYGFTFTRGAPQPSDGRVNTDTPRVDVEIDTFQDFLSLRERWNRLTPTGKLLRSPRDCYSIPVPNQQTWVMVSPEESSGHASVFWAGMKPGPGAPPHHQPTEEELFIVQSGRFSLTIGTQSAVIVPGGFGFAPRYCTHTFSNQGDEDVLIASINSPGGHDRGFEMFSRGLPMDQMFAQMPAHGFQFHF